MNEARLRLKLEKLLPAHLSDAIYKSLSDKERDEIVDVKVDDKGIKLLAADVTPRDYLKRAILHYFDSKVSAEMPTYTQLDKLAGRTKREFDMIAMEALAEMIKDFEE